VCFFIGDVMSTEITLDVMALIDRIKNIEELIEQLKKDIQLNTQLPESNSGKIHNLVTKYNRLFDKIMEIDSKKEPEKKKRKFW
jgi:ribosomal protein S15P/S13E